MPALTADIGAAIGAAKIETWTDATVKARYPNAEDGAASPAEGLFDSAADADAAIAARGALLGVERARFSVTAQDLLWLYPVAGTPAVMLTDEGGITVTALIARMEVDLNDHSTTLELFG